MFYTFDLENSICFTVLRFTAVKHSWGRKTLKIQRIMLKFCLTSVLHFGQRAFAQSIPNKIVEVDWGTEWGFGPKEKFH